MTRHRGPSDPGIQAVYERTRIIIDTSRIAFSTFILSTSIDARRPSRGPLTTDRPRRGHGTRIIIESAHRATNRCTVHEITAKSRTVQRNRCTVHESRTKPHTVQRTPITVCNNHTKPRTVQRNRCTVRANQPQSHTGITRRRTVYANPPQITHRTTKPSHGASKSTTITYRAGA